MSPRSRAPHDGASKRVLWIGGPQEYVWLHGTSTCVFLERAAAVFVQNPRSRCQQRNSVKLPSARCEIVMMAAIVQSLTGESHDYSDEHAAFQAGQ